MSTCAPLIGPPLEASSTLIFTVNGTPACAWPALAAAEEVLLRTSKRRSVSSIQYGPSVMLGVTTTAASRAAAAGGAAPGRPTGAREPPPPPREGPASGPPGPGGRLGVV